MTENVHYLPVSFGADHYIRPLIQGEVEVNSVVLLTPKQQDTESLTQAIWPVENAVASLESDFGFDEDRITHKHVPTDNFAALVAEGYQDIRRDIAKGADVYINTSSIPWALGHGYATAAAYLLEENIPNQNNETQLDVHPNQIHLYYTEPEEYLIEDLLTIAGHSSRLRKEFEKVRQKTGTLRSDVQADKQTVEAMADKLDDNHSVQEAFDGMLMLLEGAETNSIAAGFREILEGVETVTSGLNTLHQDENREVLEQLGSSQDAIGSMMRGLKELGDRADAEDATITPTELFSYFADRLERVHKVLYTVEMRYEDVEESFDIDQEAVSRIISGIESRGIAQGVRNTDATVDHRYIVPLPQYLHFDLRPTKQAIIFTLYVEGSTDSMKDLVRQVIRYTLKTHNQINLGVDIPDDPIFAKVVDGDIDNLFLNEFACPKTESKITRDTNQLVDEGFVAKSPDSKRGRQVTVTLTPAGQAYAEAHRLDEAWRKAGFEALAEKIEESAVEYIDSVDG